MYYSYAKINLLLYVISKREDSYHNIFSLMSKIDLKDEITIDFSYPEIKIKSDDESLPCDETNTMFKAASLFFEKIKKKFGVQIYIKKKIPKGAGLGGGSSNAACVLKVLNNKYDNILNKEELFKIARKIGADVPFFLLDEPAAIAEAIGDELSPLRIKKSWILLIYPNLNIPTKDVYKKLNLGLTKFSKKNNSIKFFKNNLVENGFCANFAYNDLEDVVFKQHGNLSQIKNFLIEKTKASFALMSGSGSSFFASFSNYGDAKEAKDIFSQSRLFDPGYKIFLIETL